MKRIASLLIIVVLAQPFYSQKELYRLIIGTYTNTGISQGIYTYKVDMKTGVFTQKSVTTGVTDPSYLAITPDKKFIYSVNGNDDTSAVNAFSFNSVTSKLTLLNRPSTKGGGPSYISVTKKHVFTANYRGGSISVFKRNADGSLTDVLQKLQNTGNSINIQRQSAPHVHQVIFSPDKKYLVANDLGTDKVSVYKYNSISETDILSLWDTFSTKPGSGPRHATFSKNGKNLYVLQELDGTLSVLTMKNGNLNLIQETSVAKKNMAANAADIHLSPDGKYLYATDRAPANDITCFSVTKDGKLTFKQQISTKGEGPRNFAISPDGKYLFVANQNTNNIVIFKRDLKTGLLSDTGKRIEVGAPVCLVFY